MVSEIQKAVFSKRKTSWNSKLKKRFISRSSSTFDLILEFDDVTVKSSALVNLVISIKEYLRRTLTEQFVGRIDNDKFFRKKSFILRTHHFLINHYKRHNTDKDLIQF